ncbi:FAD/NAD(P)-binding protein [Lentzea sp. HUAS12]|uniref:FAD/NAD(P)-binding protein n=1 Tax=Lentzea sp. HUAS12 TaxID=2951806 RepID=UPI0020A16AC5|nr:FAD/NAD(P)-binding protein [Lentzea sp. HUAS12]USX52709.1 FAD/NAD(P)-binding protein [Lentzea sp. HUAS12]
MPDRTRVVVVGAGASGTLAAIHLLRADVPLELVLVDRSGEFGPGRAYRTGDPGHLLNTAAGKMSALADDAGHFARWAGVAGDEFLPRGEYGRYLAETLRGAEADAVVRHLPSASGSGHLAGTTVGSHGSAAVRHLAGTAAGSHDGTAVRHLTAVPDSASRGSTSVRHLADTATGLTSHPRGVTVDLERTGPVHADFAVLAPGAGTTDPLAHLIPHDSARYVADPWAGPLPDTGGAPVLVLGTGLSMMDVSVAVAEDSVVHAISRHGLLPQPHRNGGTPKPSLPEPPRTTRLGELMAFVRRNVRAHPDRWRDVLDHLRPHTHHLWRQLDVPERRRFLDRVGHYWNVHRHRAAPTTHRRVRELIDAGRVRLHQGEVKAVRPAGEGFHVDLSGPRGDRTLTVGWLVNATGFRQDGGPLVRGLVDEGTARPDPIGLGVRTEPDGRVLDGRGKPCRIFALGALRRGELFESTAVPEIRAQAAEIAATVAAHRTR